MRKPDGGPAFPVPVREEERWEFGYPDGMTLRDWFAGQALAGGLSYCGDGQRGSWHNNANPETVARLCYDYADAMLKERDR